MVIVDTDILIDAGRNINEALTCLNQLERKFQVTISSITHMELIAGCGNKKELKSLGIFLEHFQIIQVNEEISDTATELLNHIYAMVDYQGKPYSLHYLRTKDGMEVDYGDRERLGLPENPHIVIRIF